MDPGVAQGFQAMIGSRFAPLTIFDTDMNILINTFNPAATKSASEILDKQKPWVTADVLNLCDKQKELTKKKHEKGWGKAV